MISRQAFIAWLIFSALALLGATFFLPRTWLNEFAGGVRLVGGMALLGYYGGYALHAFKSSRVGPSLRFGVGIVIFGASMALASLWHGAGRVFEFSTSSGDTPITSLTIMLQTFGILLILSAPGEINHLPPAPWKRVLTILFLGVLLGIAIVHFGHA